MARLFLENGLEINDFDAVATAAAALGITLVRRPVPTDAPLQALLGQDALTPEENAQVLTSMGDFITHEQAHHGVTAWDLVVLHPGIPDLDTKLATFARPHIHTDDEVRYVLAGEGVFGVVAPDGQQVELQVDAQEYIRVPAGTQHWFRMTPLRRIQCIRTFAGPPTWEAVFTDTSIRLGPLAGA